MRRVAGAVLSLVLLMASLATADDWDRFRGPNGSGVVRDAGYPVDFGGKSNALWRTAVRPGKSSPVLTARHIFLTGGDGDKLFTQCLDRATGRLLWERSEPRTRKEVAHSMNHPAVSTPVTDGVNVYSFFRDYGIISYNPRGEVRWKVPLGPFTNSMGLSASLILSNDDVILLADQEGGAYLAAFDQRSGALHWKTPRERANGWTTPLLHAGHIVTATAMEFRAHSAADGKESWSQKGLSPAMVASPIVHGNTLYAFGYGYEDPVPFDGTLAEFDKDKDGKLTPAEYGDDAWLLEVGKKYGGPDRVVTKNEWDTALRAISAPSALVAVRLEPGQPPRQLWRYQKSFIGVVPSPIRVNDVLYVIKNGGILTAFDGETGEVVKAGRVQGATDPYSASPVSAEGRLYLASEAGKLAVVNGGREWSVLAVNDLGEEIFATPALSGGRIYIRTAEAVYCFGPRQR